MAPGRGRRRDPRGAETLADNLIADCLPTFAGDATTTRNDSSGSGWFASPAWARQLSPGTVGATIEGWEDAAVAPEKLGTYLRSITTLWSEFGYSGAWYGHFGQGCVHTRNNFDFSTVEGLAAYRRFVTRAADLVVRLGGSLSGEHGDGQSRGELLERMYGPELVHAFREFKAVFDPRGRMNPGQGRRRISGRHQPSPRAALPRGEPRAVRDVVRCCGAFAATGGGAVCRRRTVSTGLRRDDVPLVSGDA